MTKASLGPCCSGGGEDEGGGGTGHRERALHPGHGERHGDRAGGGAREQRLQLLLVSSCPLLHLAVDFGLVCLEGRLDFRRRHRHRVAADGKYYFPCEAQTSLLDGVAEDLPAPASNSSGTESQPSVA